MLCGGIAGCIGVQAFSSFQLTTLGNSGPIGLQSMSGYATSPTAACPNYATQLVLSGAIAISPAGSGVQRFTVPVTGTYRLDANGERTAQCSSCAQYLLDSEALQLCPPLWITLSRLAIPLAVGGIAGWYAERGSPGVGPRKSREESSGRAATAVGGRAGAGGGSDALAAAAAADATAAASRSCCSLTSCTCRCTSTFLLASSSSPNSRSSSSSSTVPADAATRTSRTYDRASNASCVPEFFVVVSSLESPDARRVTSASSTSSAQPTLSPSFRCSARISATSFSISKRVRGSHGGRVVVAAAGDVVVRLCWVYEKSAPGPDDVANVFKSAADEPDAVRVGVPAMSGKFLCRVVVNKYSLV